MARQDYYAGDLFGEIYQAETPVPAQSLQSRVIALLPGFVLAGIAAMAAAFLAQSYDFPVILLGLLIGLAASFMAENERTAAGLDFVSRHALRLGIVMLGLQVTVSQLAMLGVLPLLGLLLTMACAFAAAMAAARIFSIQKEAGVLAGGATAICGASAALALYGVIGKDRLDQAKFSVTLMGVALASALAMALYPIAASMLGLTDAQVGFVMGASVHDAAQAIGGAYDYSDIAGDDATVVKLARVAMLAPVVALVAMWVNGGKHASGRVLTRIALPWFIIAFLAIVIVNSIAVIPAPIAATALLLSKSLLLLAVTATAIRSRLDTLVTAGWRPLMPVLFATLASAAAGLGVALAVVG